MSSKTATIGVRVSEETSRIIQQISASLGQTPSDLLAGYAEEIARQHRFCHIEFRDSPLGRLAHVEGTRTAVWLIVDLVRAQGGDIAKTARLHGWPETKVRAAVNYAAAFPQEIEPLIERAHSVTGEELKVMSSVGRARADIDAGRTKTQAEAKELLASWAAAWTSK